MPLCYINIGNIHYYQGSYAQAIEYYLKSLKITEELQDKKGMSLCYMNIGIVHSLQGSYAQAIEYYFKSLKITEKLQDKKGIAQCYNNIGNVHYEQGSYAQAIEYYLKSLKIKEELQDKKGMAQCYNNIGLVHSDQGSYAQAIEYYLKSLKITEELQDKKGMSACYTNIGNVHNYQGSSSSDPKVRADKYAQAIEYYLKSLKINEELQDKKGMSACYNNIGSVHSDQGSYAQAIEYYLKSLKIKEALQDKNGIATSYVNIAILNYTLADSAALSENQKLNYLKTALEYGIRAIELAREIKAMPMENDAASALMKAYNKLGNFKKAMEYAEIYIATKDSMFKEEKTKAITEMDTKYQTEKKQLEIEKLNKEKELQTANLGKKEAENKKQRIIIGFVVGGLFFVVIFSIFLFRLLMQKKRANLLLAHQNVEIMQQKEEILTQAEELRTMNEEITTINEQLTAVNQELEKLSIVASKTDNSVVIHDMDGNIEWVNDGFTRLFGYTLEEFIRIKGKHILDTSANPKIKEVIAECMELKKSVVYILPSETKSGNTIWVQTVLTPITDDSGCLTKLVAIDTDITKLKQAETEIIRKNTQITDSINYAKLIQDAMLPSQHLINKHIPECFIFFRPRDIVSGDFYWFSVQEDKIFIAAADCTGHGVPGAFMSMIGCTLLNDIIVKDKIFEPAEILSRMNEGVTNALGQNINYNIETSHDDGMVLTLCCIDKAHNKILISSANQSYYIITEGE
ncbi:MAG: tetratricopeptide repeat protein, partial [Bacteroidia bacterium]|nr:tetratricopeptide repeat protein [Bacteroidia bacterium]